MEFGIQVEPQFGFGYEEFVDIAHHAERVLEMRDGQIIRDSQVPQPLNAEEAVLTP